MRLMHQRLAQYFLLGVILIMPQFAAAQLGGFSASSDVGAILDHTIYPKEGVAEGEVLTLLIHATIDPGFHIYSANQVEDAQPNAAIFDLDEEAQDIELVGTLDDRGDRKTHFDEIFEYEVAEFYNEVTFVQKVKITGPNPRLVGYLRYQLCDESMCIPKTYDLDQTIPLAEKKKEETTSNPSTPQQAEVQQVEEKDEEPEPNEEEPEEKQGSRPGIVDATDWEVTFSSKELQNGDTLRIRFSLQIEEGYHVYSSIPPKQPAGLPTTFNFNGKSQDLELLGNLKEYGEAETVYDEVFETDVILFHDSVRFEQLMLVTGDSPMLEGYLAYQVCDDRLCVNEKVEIFEQFGNELASPQAADAESAESSQESTGLGWLILQGFLLGLASIFTPCIFPMIPLTVSIFTKQGGSRKAGIRKGLFYGLSIVVIFTGLALLISLIFGPAAIQQVSNHPAFNVFFFVILFVFALSFLGMFEITLPSSWSTAMSKRGDKGGLAGIFFMAMALAIVSFSCTGPLVATLLGEAFSTGKIFSPAVGMFSFSLALALPFMLLAIFPSWLQSMPRSGGWLNAVKVVLGLIELALALIYLSRADLVMHWGLLDREIFIGAWVVIFTMVGVYLLGKIQLPHDSPIERISVPRFLLAMCSFWFVLYLVPGLWGAPLRMLGGFIPNNTRDMGVLIQQEQMVFLQGTANTSTSLKEADVCNYPNKISGHLSKDTPLGFCAFYDLAQGMAYAKEAGKPVFLDFTGHTCANCRFLEKNAWIDPEVRRLIAEEYVLISLYTDDREELPAVEKTAEGKKLRTVGDKWLQYEIDTYQSTAQPFYVLLDNDGSLLAEPTGYNPPLDIEAFRAFFQKGLEEFRSRH